MRQLAQDIRSGKISVVDVPDPVVRPGTVLIENRASLISAGTEGSLLDFGRKSLLRKALARPDHVKRVVEKARREGLERARAVVKGRLDQAQPMGYASAGTVRECGYGVRDLAPGDLVASNGPHAQLVCVPRNLCAKVVGAVSPEQAAFAVLGAIAMHGVRLTRTDLAETVLVVGLGLVGQLCIAVLRARGVRVWATDPDSERCDLALRMGAVCAIPGMAAEAVQGATNNLGADAVLVAAASASSDPLALATAAVRKRGRVVVLGDVGMELDRRQLYFKEAEVVVSCSYGPGRYDPQYEDHGRDYPASYVRWTEQRNLQAVLDLMASGELDVTPLISHRYDLEDAGKAYELLRSAEAHLAILLRYPGPRTIPERRVSLAAGVSRPAPIGSIGVGLVGSGSFARGSLIPLISRSRRLRPHAICSANGLNATRDGLRAGFAFAVSDEAAIYADDAVDAVVIATPHHLHAAQICSALEAGKHVFVEKPLCLSLEELDQIEAALGAAPASLLLAVDFNRRFAPAAQAARAVFRGLTTPLTVSIRFNAGALPAEHWTQRSDVGGGRILGEACHAVDLAAFLVGSAPTRVYAAAVGKPGGLDDECFVTLQHECGGLSSIGYLAGGDRSLPKERIEIIGGGRAAIIDDFRTLTTHSGGRTSRQRWRGQNKGHAAALEAFERCLVGSASVPIPWPELRAVSRATILAVASLRTGAPQDV